MMIKVVICPNSQFDVELVEKHGYDGVSAFLAGNRNDLPNGLSWKIDSTFCPQAPYCGLASKYESILIKIRVGQETIVDFNGNNSEFQDNKDSDLRDFWWNKGECFNIRITNEMPEMTIETNLPVQVYLIDPKIEMLDTRTQMGGILGTSNVGSTGTAK